MNIIEKIEIVKAASIDFGLLDIKSRNNILYDIANALRNNIEEILIENLKDLQNLNENDPMYDRLLLNKDRIHNIANSVEFLINLKDPLFNIVESKDISDGLKVEKISVPLGVVMVIYEARPNVTIDAIALSIKSGNACILKGGKEARYSNIILTNLVKKVIQLNGINNNAIMLFLGEKDELIKLIQANKLIDVCIPRGSANLINFVRQNATIPVIETGAGVVHVYFDEYGDLEKGKNIILNAKTRRVSVCNALDCLLIHKNHLNNLYHLIQELQYHKVELYVDKLSYDILKNYPSNLLHIVDDFKYYGTEFLSYKMSIKIVNSIDDAINHISNYTSNHTEAIISEDKDNIEYFIKSIDAAVICVNASTSFTDGEQFGMIAEIGISTQKLHARGPMGLNALTTYKWIVQGNGHVRI